MKGLLLIAHGSSRKEANEEFILLVSKVQSRLPDHLVQHAFLDCATPTIQEGVDLLIGKQACEIVVLPHFLVSGKHTIFDITKIVDAKRKGHPAVKFDLKPPVGSSAEMIELILKMIQD